MSSSDGLHITPRGHSGRMYTRRWWGSAAKSKEEIESERVSRENKVGEERRQLEEKVRREAEIVRQFSHLGFQTRTFNSG